MNKLRILSYSIVVALVFTVSFIIVWLFLYTSGLLPYVIWWVILGFYVITSMWMAIILVSIRVDEQTATRKFKKLKMTRREAVNNLILNYKLSEAKALIMVNEIYDEMEKK